mgnify:CR=1 FL=1
MGSEMCIRDRVEDVGLAVFRLVVEADGLGLDGDAALALDLHGICLLYTSDAADERSSVDLGGRRIIKKKKRHAPIWTDISEQRNKVNTRCTKREKYQTTNRNV